jgi:hypothetical protein
VAKQDAGASEHDIESLLLEVVHKTGKELAQGGERPDLLAELDASANDHMAAAVTKHAGQLRNGATLANARLATDQNHSPIAAHDRLADLDEAGEFRGPTEETRRSDRQMIAR